MKILVTGASGFAAEHLLPLLLESGHFVVGIDRKRNPSNNVNEFHSLDLLDMNKNYSGTKDIDIIVHLAAARADWGISDAEYYRDNTEATSALLEFAIENGIKNFLFVSSIAVYPQDALFNISEQSPTGPINAYGKSKLNAEQILINHCRTDPEFSLNIVRPAVLYGPSDTKKTSIQRAIDNNIFRMIDGIYKRRFAFVGKKGVPKATAYIENFAEALVWLLPKRKGYETFLYADTPTMTTDEMVQWIRVSFGLRGLGPIVPLKLATFLSSIFDVLGPVIKVNFPITKARILTFNRPTNVVPEKIFSSGFKQKYTNFESLNKTVKWYLDEIKTKNLNTFFVHETHDDKAVKKNDYEG